MSLEEHSDLIQDILDNLQLLESLLLEYEKFLGTGEHRTSLVQLMFRYAHNSKGALGLMGLEEEQQLVHHAEAVLDLVRSNRLLLSPLLIDALLASISRLHACLEDRSEPRDFSALIKQLEAASAAGANSESQPAQQHAETKWNDYLSQGLSVYGVEKLIDTDISKEDFEALPIFEDIKALGTIVLVDPSFEECKSRGKEAAITVTFTSSKTEEEIGNHLFDPVRVIAAAPKMDVHHQEPAPGAKAVRILVVEDEVVSRQMLGRILAKHGTCDVAADGKEGLTLFLLSLEENDPYSLVCLDIMMPEMDGRELLRLIRKAEEDRSLSLKDSAKVIMTTCLDDPKNILGSFKDGCEGYITKPVEVDKLRALINKLLPTQAIP